MALRKERKVIQDAWNGLTGKECNIQFKSKRGSEWISYTISGPTWKWRHFEYRIKPQTNNHTQEKFDLIMNNENEVKEKEVSEETSNVTVIAIGIGRIRAERETKPFSRLLAQLSVLKVGTSKADLFVKQVDTEEELDQFLVKNVSGVPNGNLSIFNTVGVPVECMADQVMIAVIDDRVITMVLTLVD